MRQPAAHRRVCVAHERAHGDVLCDQAFYYLPPGAAGRARHERAELAELARGRRQQRPLQGHHLAVGGRQVLWQPPESACEGAVWKEGRFLLHPFLPPRAHQMV